MRLFLKNLFWTLLISIIAGLIVYSVTIAKPNIKYSLLGPIPVSMSNVSSNVQQLDIKNFGNQSAHDITVKIKGDNVTYELLKYSLGDIEKVFSSENQLEIIYPQLPPEANISIIIKSQDPIVIKDIAVSHQNGKGKEILSSSNDFLLDYLIILVGYIIFSLLGWRGSNQTYLESVAYWSPNDILEKENPFYLSQAKWKSIRELAIRTKIFNDSKFRNYIELEKDEKFNLLSGDKPEYLNQSEWETLSSETREKLSNYLEFRIANAQRPQDVLNLLSSQKPQHYSQSKWNDFINECNNRFVELRLGKITLYPSLKHYIAEINSEKPDVISTDHWNKYLTEVKRRLATTLELELIDAKNPLEYLTKIETEIDFEGNAKFILRRTAYRLQLSKVKPVYNISEAQEFLREPKPIWIEEDDYQVLQKNAKNIVECETLKNQYGALLSILNGIIENKAFPNEKPDNVLQADWDHLKDIDSTIRVKGDEINSKQELVQKKEEELADTEKLKNKVLLQLSIIQEILHDPTVLDRIEEYEEIFSAGNYQNLRLIAGIINSSQQRT